MFRVETICLEPQEVLPYERRLITRIEFSAGPVGTALLIKNQISDLARWYVQANQVLSYTPIDPFPCTPANAIVPEFTGGTLQLVCLDTTGTRTQENLVTYTRVEYMLPPPLFSLEELTEVR